MPKLIYDLENRLMEEAKRQAETGGYGAVTIRSVAKACGVGVGTVYNYFSSKDALLAAYMLRDWEACIAEIKKVSEAAEQPEPVLRCMYEQLTAFSGRHRKVFQDEAAVTVFSNSFNHYHALLREQLVKLIQKFCADVFTADFIAEALLTWTTAGKAFHEIYQVIGKLF